MSDHYFSSSPVSKSFIRVIEHEWRGVKIRFETDNGTFSKTEVDQGSRILMDALPEEIRGNVLDLGCGWGAVGVTVGKRYPDAGITMCDVNERALALAGSNAAKNGVKAETVLSDGLSNVEGSFDLIITNPPIRAGKQVIYRLFEESRDQLSENGCLYMVIRKQQGAESAIKYLKTLFGSVKTVDKSAGFWVIRCEQNESEGA